MGPDGLRGLALLAVLLCAACGGADPAPSSKAPAGSATVDSVRDGDTILLESGDRVRLLQVDAPELGVECWGDESARELERLLPPGTELRLEADAELDSVDRHGRLLRYVHASGQNVNVALVRAGAAAPYFYRQERGRHARELLGAAEAAQAAGRGLWGGCPTTRLVPGRQVDTGRG